MAKKAASIANAESFNWVILDSCGDEVRFIKNATEREAVIQLKQWADEADEYTLAKIVPFAKVAVIEPQVEILA